jgi:hypothetical protein
MTSQINPFNINGQYPVAGQDNNSQGFRTNFTNTSTNFEYAAQEITALQTNAVLKAPLAGVTLDNNMNGQLLFNASTNQITQAIYSYGIITNSTQVISYTAGYLSTVDEMTQSNTSFSFSNLNTIPDTPPGVLATWAVSFLTVTAGQSVTFTGTYVNAQGIQGWEAGNTFTFAADGAYTFEFSTTDSGATIAVKQVNNTLQPFNNSSEDLATATAANLALTTSYFSTAAAETATLAAGVAGQIKTFAMFADSGDMVITVTNAGWKTSGTGTITFDTIGDACTLQYINAKWFCIGNNGCTFA